MSIGFYLNLPLALSFFPLALSFFKIVWLYDKVVARIEFWVFEKVIALLCVLL